MMTDIAIADKFTINRVPLIYSVKKRMCEEEAE